MARFHATLSEHSVYLRYFHMIPFDSRIAHERLARIWPNAAIRQQRSGRFSRSPLCKEDQAKEAEFTVHSLATNSSDTDRERSCWDFACTTPETVSSKQSWNCAPRSYCFRLLTYAATLSSEALVSAAQNYARFLTTSDRWNEAPAAIKRYRDLIVATHGAATSSLGDVSRLSMEFERMRGTPQGAIKLAEELLALQESLGGNTSDLYLGAAEELARQHQSDGDRGSAIPIFRRNAEIADLAYRPSDMRRVQGRITAAMALAQQRQFDEAEKLATEAVAIAKALWPPQDDMFSNQLEQIRYMRNASPRNPANGNGRWFQQSKHED